MRTLVLMLKHGKYESLGFRLGRGLGNVFPRPDVDFLVPVPLHRKSKRRYNQAEALARGIGAAWNVQVKDVAFWTTDVPTRAGMRVGERLSLSEGAFGFREEVAGLRVAFVDDVCTTGSTLACLAKAAQARDAEIEGAFALAGTPGFR
jgi:predicted amidophosphoribosyltransferase